MTDDFEDTGFTGNGLWAISWFLGLVAVASLIRMLFYIRGGDDVRPEYFVWVLLGAGAAAFSASCAVLAGLKSFEERILKRLHGSKA